MIRRRKGEQRGAHNVGAWREKSKARKEAVREMPDHLIVHIYIYIYIYIYICMKCMDLIATPVRVVSP
ncbi:hypothetical protein ACOSQ3_002706 [Xanthoceras sorbifolium]